MIAHASNMKRDNKDDTGVAKLHTPPTELRRVLNWYRKAQIDYTVHYLQLYIAYNAWYYEATGSMNDREAIARLMKRYVIWDDYLQGKVLRELEFYMERLSELTQREPFPSAHMVWDGVVRDSEDWHSLIEFWYQTRCQVVHGSQVEQKHAWFAYETLNIFMGEIMSRMNAQLKEFQSEEGQQELAELATLSKLPDIDGSESKQSEQFHLLRRKLYLKYIASPNIWQVDMKRVGET